MVSISPCVEVTRSPAFPDMRTTLRRIITSRVNLMKLASPSDFIRPRMAPATLTIRTSCLAPCSSHRKSLCGRKAMLPGVRARSSASQLRNGSNNDHQTGNTHHQQQQSVPYKTTKKDIGIEENTTIVRVLCDSSTTLIVCEE